jgi:imidazolonepropionase-like amidohydrolase
MQHASRLLPFTLVLLAAGLPAIADPLAATPVADLVVTNARVFDGRGPGLREAQQVVIAGGRIVAIERSGAPFARGDSTVLVDAGGRVLLPGLIDAHVHPALPVALSAYRDGDPGYLAARSGAEARAILMRGFTTVRDMGGPAFGLRQAIDEGVIEGPRIFPSGAIVSQTSGHGDFRQRSAPPRLLAIEADPMERAGYSALADGPAEVLAAVREQLRLGATQIKLAAGGGISSVFDPIDSVQYTPEELRAAVAATADWGTYVAVHAYTPESIRRAIEAGVKSIEHGHLIDEPTMKLIGERGVFLSPQAYVFSGALVPATSPPPTAAQAAQRAKAQMVSAGLDRMMQLAKRHGVKIAFGTDVFGSSRVFEWQPKEFAARLRWFTPVEILRQATSINGELLALSGARNPYGGRLGVIEAGALADLLVVEGNPLEDIGILEDSARSLKLIVKDGKIVSSSL